MLVSYGNAKILASTVIRTVAIGSEDVLHVPTVCPYYNKIRILDIAPTWIVWNFFSFFRNSRTFGRCDEFALEVITRRIHIFNRNDPAIMNMSLVETFRIV